MLSPGTGAEVCVCEGERESECRGLMHLSTGYKCSPYIRLSLKKNPHCSDSPCFGLNYFICCGFKVVELNSKEDFLCNLMAKFA